MSIPFIDLKTQYEQMKTSIDERIHRVLDHGMYIMGPEVKECETALAAFTGTKHANACASGTDALVMALMALGVGPGDEVITTSFSFIATAESIALVGAVPVFVDVEEDTCNIDVGQIEAAITTKTKAIMPVSLYGQVADMNEINALAEKHKLYVIEDAAQSFGATYEGKRSCNLSTVGCTSFFPAKPLGCYGDGGAVFTNDDALALKLEQIRNHGQTERYHHEFLGINGRLDSIQCAVLLTKIEYYADEIKKRQQVAENYNRAFSSLAEYGVKLPVVRKGRDSVWAQYTLQVPNREGFRSRLSDAGVPTAVHYPKTMPDQPAFKNLGRTVKQSMARLLSEKVVSLPMHPFMDTSTQSQIIDAVTRAAKG